MRCTLATFAAFVGFAIDCVILAVTLATFTAAALCLTCAVNGTASSFATLAACAFGAVAFGAVGSIFGSEIAKARTVRERAAARARVYI